MRVLMPASSDGVPSSAFVFAGHNTYIPRVTMSLGRLAKNLFIGVGLHFMTAFNLSVWSDSKLSFAMGPVETRALNRKTSIPRRRPRRNHARQSEPGLLQETAVLVHDQQACARRHRSSAVDQVRTQSPSSQLWMQWDTM